MFQPIQGRVLVCCAAVALLAGCADDVPVAPGAPDGPSLAVGFYGLSGAPTGPVGRPCVAAEYRQFDFWVGQWEVQIFGTGAPSGSNIITSELGGCAVFEGYANAGYVGRSLNTYDAADGGWHQHWMANDGVPLVLDGGFTGGSMILQGSRPSPAGTVLDRINWTALEAGQLRQFWESSLDDGQTWTVSFDGLYLPRASVTQDPEVSNTGCTNPAFPNYRLFDFAVGEWDVEVEGAGRAVPGLRSIIGRDLSDCLTEERLTGRAGYEARVFSTMRRRTGEWQRTFMDNRGIRVFLSGFPSAGSLVLTGTMPLAGGTVADVRSVWEPEDGNRFTQRYETSTDGGATWELLLEASYRRR